MRTKRGALRACARDASVQGLLPLLMSPVVLGDGNMAKVTDLVVADHELTVYPYGLSWDTVVEDNWKVLDQLEDELEALGYDVLPRLTLDGGAVGDLIPLDETEEWNVLDGEDDGWNVLDEEEEWNVLDETVTGAWTDDWSDEWIPVPPPATTRW